MSVSDLYIPTFGTPISCSRIGRPITENINRPQKHECRNWDCSRAVPFMGIFVSNFLLLCLCSVLYFSNTNTYSDSSFPLPLSFYKYFLPLTILCFQHHISQIYMCTLSSTPFHVVLVSPISCAAATADLMRLAAVYTRGCMDGY